VVLRGTCGPGVGKRMSDEQAAVPTTLSDCWLEEAKILASDRFLSVGCRCPDQTIVTAEDELKAIIFKAEA